MIKKYLILLTVLILAVLLILGPRAFKVQRKELVEDPILRKIKTQGKIVVGTDATYPPMESIDEKGNFVGLDIDIAKEIASDLKVQIEFKNIPWETLISFEPLQKGEVDMLISSITITPERAEKVAFSDPYLNAGQVIVTTVEKLGEIKGVGDLANKKVGVQINTTSENEAKKYTSSVIAFDDYIKAKEALLKGEIDAIVIDYPAGLGLVSKEPKLKIVGEPFTQEFYGIAVRKDATEFLKEINKTIRRLKMEGKLETLIQSWFSK
jgi:polar amino acid transport system substrate-binding protein